MAEEVKVNTEVGEGVDPVETHEEALEAGYFRSRTKALRSHVEGEDVLQRSTVRTFQTGGISDG